MAFEKRYRIKLDNMDKKVQSQNPKMTFKQGDCNVYPIEITLLSGGEPIDLTGSTVTFISKTAKTSKEIAGACEFKDAPKGKISYTLTTSEVLEVGKVEAEIICVKGEQQLTSTRFSYEVEDSISTEEAVKASTEYGVFLEALKNVGSGGGVVPAPNGVVVEEKTLAEYEALAPDDSDETIYLIPRT